MKVINRFDITDCISESTTKIQSCYINIHIIFPISCAKQTHREKSCQILHSLGCLWSHLCRQVCRLAQCRNQHRQESNPKSLLIINIKHLSIFKLAIRNKKKHFSENITTQNSPLLLIFSRTPLSFTLNHSWVHCPLSLKGKQQTPYQGKKKHV